MSYESERDMDVHTQIVEYIAAQPERKRIHMHALHDLLQGLMPGCRLWFLDGKDERGRVISNPNIGYGVYTMKYADGRAREFYQIGVSANTTGLSVYIMGLTDKSYLVATYGKTLGNATVTGYCIKFRSLGVINLPMLEAAIRDGVQQSFK